MNRQTRILVFIDGPPESTCENARLPTLISVVNSLASHKIDVVLDDYNRCGEKRIVAYWKEALQKRGLSFVEEAVPLEKGAWKCSINQ